MGNSREWAGNTRRGGWNLGCLTWGLWREYITAIREKEEKYTKIFHDLKNFMVSLGRKGLLT